MRFVSSSQPHAPVNQMTHQRINFCKIQKEGQKRGNLHKQQVNPKCSFKSETATQQVATNQKLSNPYKIMPGHTTKPITRI